MRMEEVQLPEKTGCILGGPGTGTSRALVERAAALLEGGARPCDVLVLAASPNAAAGLRELLAARLGAERAAAVPVRTPRELELQLLATPQARAFTGREPRLLLNYELNALMEDMKTSGLRPGRLKEMLKFFYRGWTELAANDPDWLISDEELQVHRLLGECLAFYGGLLECEVAALAVNFARADAAVFEPLRADHVLVDGYQALCRASQVFAGMLARASLTVAGDVFACAETYEPYPCAAGLDELAATEGVQVQKLEVSAAPRAVVAAACALRDHAHAALAELDAECREERLAAEARLENLTIDQMRAKLEASGAAEKPWSPLTPAHTSLRAAEDAPAGAVESLVLETPEAEAAAVADRVEAALAAGVAPERVCVAVPNRAWTAAMGRELASRGVAVATAFDPRSLNGDLRDLARCAVPRVLTLLQLAADPCDSAAWRTWCGMGDWLANSPGFCALRNVGLGAGAGLHETLASLSDAAERAGAANPADVVPGERLGADERASIDRIVAAYRTGSALAAQLAGLTGAGLLERASQLALGSAEAPVPAILRTLAASLGNPAFDAAGFVGHVRAVAAGEGSLAARPGSVCLGALEQLAGLPCDLLAVSGFVNGFTPRHAYFDQVSTSPAKQRQMRAAEARRLYCLLCGCAGVAVFTSFTQLDALQAERLDLRVDRIRMRAGRRVAAVSPSLMLEALGL